MAVNSDIRHLGHLFFEHMLKRPDALCQIDAATGKSERNSSVLARSIRLARCLRRFGTKPGDVLALHGKNHLDLHIPYYAALLNGMPIVGVDPMFKFAMQRQHLTRAEMLRAVGMLEAGSVQLNVAEAIGTHQNGAQKPFKRVIKANIGDAHAMGQQPITFIRQVLACVVQPELIESGKYPSDVKERARAVLAACGGQSAGSYTMSHGVELIRRHVAEYIERRDGHKADWQNICTRLPNDRKRK